MAGSVRERESLARVDEAPVTWADESVAVGLGEAAPVVGDCCAVGVEPRRSVTVRSAIARRRSPGATTTSTAASADGA